MILLKSVLQGEFQVREYIKLRVGTAADNGVILPPICTKNLVYTNLTQISTRA